MPSWITKNGRHIPIYPKRNRILSSEVQHIQKNPYNSTSRIPYYKFPTRKPPIKQEKKWYEEGWRQEIFKFHGTDYAVDLGNFGNYNFSLAIRKGDKEIFVVPKYLIKNAISCGLTAMTGIPGCPFNVPVGAIEHAIRLYDQLAN